MSSNSTIVLNSNEVLDQMGKETLKEPRLDDFDYPHMILLSINLRRERQIHWYKISSLISSRS